MARAYAFAKGDGPLPTEIRLANVVQRFGSESVYGRPLGAKEIRQMELSENVIMFFREKYAQSNQAEWANQNPYANDLLMHALKCAIDLGMLDDR